MAMFVASTSHGENYRLWQRVESVCAHSRAPGHGATTARATRIIRYTLLKGSTSKLPETTEESVNELRCSITMSAHLSINWRSRTTDLPVISTSTREGLVKARDLD